MVLHVPFFALLLLIFLFYSLLSPSTCSSYFLPLFLCLLLLTVLCMLPLLLLILSSHGPCLQFLRARLPLSLPWLPWLLLLLLLLFLWFCLLLFFLLLLLLFFFVSSLFSCSSSSFFLCFLDFQFFSASPLCSSVLSCCSRRWRLVWCASLRIRRFRSWLVWRYWFLGSRQRLLLY